MPRAEWQRCGRVVGQTTTLTRRLMGGRPTHSATRLLSRTTPRARDQQPTHCTINTTTLAQSLTEKNSKERNRPLHAAPQRDQSTNVRGSLCACGCRFVCLLGLWMARKEKGKKREKSFRLDSLFTFPLALRLVSPLMLRVHWSCPACTYLNPPSATERCEVCATFRTEEAAARAAALSESRQRQQLQRRLQEQERTASGSASVSVAHSSDPDGDVDMAAVSASGSWLCPACTNLNRKSSVKCSACLTTRASSDAIAAAAASAAAPTDAATGRASKRRKGPAATAVAIDDDDDDDDGTAAGASASASASSAGGPSSAPRPARSRGDSAPHIHTSQLTISQSSSAVGASSSNSLSAINALKSTDWTGGEPFACLISLSLTDRLTGRCSLLVRSFGLSLLRL